MGQKINQKGIELIEYFEGNKLTAYVCPAGKLTIGIGHTGKDVFKGMTITKEQSYELFRKDIARFETQLNSLNLSINDNQFSALVSFIYNLGFGSLQKSNLLLKVKANPNDDRIKGEFNKWVFSNGKKLPGLMLRRQKEAELYFS